MQKITVFSIILSILRQNTIVFAFSEHAAAQIQLFFLSASVRQPKYNCIFLQRTCGNLNTTVFAFSEHAAAQIQLFFLSANVRQPKYNCFSLQRTCGSPNTTVFPLSERAGGFLQLKYLIANRNFTCFGKCML